MPDDTNDQQKINETEFVKVYNKLVRDKIPEIIEADGKVCRTHILPNEEWGFCLRRRFL